MWIKHKSEFLIYVTGGTGFNNVRVRSAGREDLENFMRGRETAIFDEKLESTSFYVELSADWFAEILASHAKEMTPHGAVDVGWGIKLDTRWGKGWEDDALRERDRKRRISEGLD
jgi:hypothetical protein